MKPWISRPSGAVQRHSLPRGDRRPRALVPGVGDRRQRLVRARLDPGQRRGSRSAADHGRERVVGADRRGERARSPRSLRPTPRSHAAVAGCGVHLQRHGVESAQADREQPAGRSPFAPADVDAGGVDAAVARRRPDPRGAAGPPRRTGRCRPPRSRRPRGRRANPGPTRAARRSTSGPGRRPWPGRSRTEARRTRRPSSVPVPATIATISVVAAPGGLPDVEVLPADRPLLAAAGVRRATAARRSSASSEDSTSGSQGGAGSGARVLDRPGCPSPARRPVRRWSRPPPSGSSNHRATTGGAPPPRPRR